MIYRATEPELIAGLLAELREVGATFPDEEAVAEHLQQWIDEAGDRRCADMLAVIASRFPRGRNGDSLRAVFERTVLGWSSSKIARKNGVSKQAWYKGLQKIRTALFGQNG